MIMDNPQERELPSGGYYVESAKTDFLYWYDDGHLVCLRCNSNYCSVSDSKQIVASGSLRAQMNQTGKIDVLEHAVSEFHEHVPLKTLKVESPEQKPSPNLTKSGKKAAAAQQRANKAPPPAPKPAVTDWGLSTSAMYFLEVEDIY